MSLPGTSRRCAARKSQSQSGHGQTRRRLDLVASDRERIRAASPSIDRLRPSFETHRLRDAPQDEDRGGCRYDKNLGNAVLGETKGALKKPMKWAQTSLPLSE
jgi:hypothetical protein